MNKRKKLIHNGMFEVKMSKKDWAMEEFKKSLDPNMDKADKVKLILEHMHRRDEDAIQAMSDGRVDSNERRVAFVEPLINAIQTDTESIERKERFMNKKNKNKGVICDGDIVGMVIISLREKNVCENCSETTCHTKREYRQRNHRHWPHHSRADYRFAELIGKSKGVFIL